MPASGVVIVGAGGFGREVLDVLEAINSDEVARGGAVKFEFLGFLDDGEPDVDLLSRRGAAHLGPVTAALDLPPGTSFSLGVGDPNTRRCLDEYLTGLGLSAVTLAHPSATCGFDVRVGVGAVICSHVSLTTNVAIGRHTHLNLNCTVGHDVVMGDYVTVFPGANISGCVVIEDEVSVGTNSTIIQGLSVGRGTVIGGGAAVVRPLPPRVVAAGVPARVIRSLDAVDSGPSS